MDQQTFKRQADVEIVSPQRLILRSANGSKWQLTVSNLGVLVVTAI